MKKSAKIISVALAVLMALSVLPFAAFAAEDEGAASRVDGWKDNYTLLIDYVLDDTNYASYNYVDENLDAIYNKTTAYTALALYDGAWKNYATGDQSVANAEHLLLNLIEKAEYNFDDGYVDEIVSVLETASDVNDFIQKVNEYANIELFASSGWGTAFEVIGDVTKVANAYQTYRDEFVEAYANVLSVQMANAYYIDLLTYIAENSEYAVLTAAANNLIADINASVESVIEEILAKAAADGADMGVDYIIKLAMNSNAYTAVALKVYQGATSVVDFLWNVSGTYTYLDTLMSAYYFQALAADWAEDAIYGEDEDKALIAADFILTARDVCDDGLYNLMLAENDGVVGKITDKLYGTAFEDIQVNESVNGIIRKVMFDIDIEEFAPVARIIKVYCPVSVEVLDASNKAVYTLNDGEAKLISNAYGIFESFYSEYANDYIKVAFLYDNAVIRLVGTDAGKVTVVMEALNGDTYEDWSFTDVAIAAGENIVFNTAYDETPAYFGSNIEKTDFNDEFVPSVHEKATVKEVAEAAVEVGKDEAKGLAAMIKAFFQSIIDFFKNLFK